MIDLFCHLRALKFSKRSAGHFPAQIQKSVFKEVAVLDALINLFSDFAGIGLAIGAVLAFISGLIGMYVFLK